MNMHVSEIGHWLDEPEPKAYRCPFCLHCAVGLRRILSHSVPCLSKTRFRYLEFEGGWAIALGFLAICCGIEMKSQNRFGYESGIWVVWWPINLPPDVALRCWSISKFRPAPY